VENCDYSDNYKGKGRREESNNCRAILIFLVCQKILPVILADKLTNWKTPTASYQRFNRDLYSVAEPGIIFFVLPITEKYLGS
jgi:hypothetical protein